MKHKRWMVFVYPLTFEPAKGGLLDCVGSYNDRDEAFDAAFEIEGAVRVTIFDRYSGVEFERNSVPQLLPESDEDDEPPSGRRHKRAWPAVQKIDWSKVDASRRK